MLIRLAGLGALGYAGFRYFQKQKADQNEAYGSGSATGSRATQDTWDTID